MKSVGAYEAKTHLSELLDQVQKGDTITITRHGVPIAQLVPTPEGRRERILRAIEDIKKIRERVGPPPPGSPPIKEMMHEGHRY